LKIFKFIFWVKNGLVKQQGLLETDTPLTLWCQAVEISNSNRRSPVTALPAEEICKLLNF